MRDDAEARRRYLGYMRVEAQLQWRYSAVAENGPTEDFSTIEEKETAMKSAPSLGHITRVCVLAGTVMFANAFGQVEATAGETAQATASSAPAKLKAEGNYNEALILYAKLIVDPAHGGKDAVQDLYAAVDCLRRLNRIAEWDDLVEQVVTAHPTDWRVLRTADQRPQRLCPRVAGKFR